MNRCDNCMEPYARHVIRPGAVPICPDYKSWYREAADDEPAAERRPVEEVDRAR